MLSLTTPTQIPTSNHRLLSLKASLIPALLFACKSKKRDKNCQNGLIVGFGLMEERREYIFGRIIDNYWCLRCQQSDGYVDLDAEILAFMAKSDRPTMFPTKEELLIAGRFDLVNSIKEKGGWYSFGWDDEIEGDCVEETADFDIAEFQRRIESCKQTASSSFSEGVLNSSSRNLDSPQISLDASSQLDSDEDSGRLAVDEDSGKLVVDKDSGIDGILSGLKKQRNNGLMGIKLEKDRYEARSRSEDGGNGGHSDSSLGFGRSNLEDNGKLSPDHYHKGTLDSNGRNIRHYTEPDTWKSWSSRRAGSQLTEFEAAEISLGKNSVDADKDGYHDGIIVNTKEYGDGLNNHKEINYNEIRNRLQHLESELTAVLLSVRSKRVDINSEEVTGRFSELHSFSDALEFRENEVMSAKEVLRTLRTKLAILEGKMTLATFNARKRVEVKNRKTDDVAYKSLLQSATIVWHSSATQVLLMGSFDGWTTQRKMEKLKSGVFSITLKLYPGRYEIKFIVDGEWKLDPLRPIVNNNGYRNNLFTVV